MTRLASAPPRVDPHPLTELVVRQRPFVPTDMQLDALAARAAGGSRKEAAKLLGWTDGKLAYHLRTLLLGLRAHDDAQAIFVLRHELADRVKHP